VESNLEQQTPKLNVTNVSSAVFGKDGPALGEESKIGKLSRILRTTRIKVNNVEKITAVSRDKISRIVDILKTQQITTDDKLSVPKKNEGIGNIGETLIETNRILVEIQNQLAYDFAMQVAERKEENKELKEKQSKKRFKKEESALEKSRKKIANALQKTTEKTVAPLKNIFEKIKDFLTIVGLGIATNTIFEFLSKEENREKLSEWFDLVAKNWKWIGAGVLGFLALKPIFGILGAIGGIIALFRTAADVFRFARRIVFGKPPAPTTGGQSGTSGGAPGGRMSGGSNTGLYYGRNVDPTSGRQLRSNASISRYNESMARSLQGKANLGDRARLFFRNNNIRLPKINRLPNLRGIPRAGALSAIFAGVDYLGRKGAGQTETQAISGAVSATGGGMAGFALASKATATALSPLLVAPIPGSRLLYGALVLGAGIYGGMKGAELFGGVSDKVTGVEPRAMGGPVMAGNTYLVGEKGPELVKFTGNGQVINNMQTEKIYKMITSGKKGRTRIVELPPQTIEGPKPEIKLPQGPATKAPQISSSNSLDGYRSVTSEIYGIMV